jgi:hypothetical protein
MTSVDRRHIGERDNVTDTGVIPDGVKAGDVEVNGATRTVRPVTDSNTTAEIRWCINTKSI